MPTSNPPATTSQPSHGRSLPSPRHHEPSIPTESSPMHISPAREPSLTSTSRGGGLDADSDRPSPTPKRKPRGGKNVSISEPIATNTRLGRQQSGDSNMARKSPDVKAAQLSLQEYRAKLTRDIERRELPFRTSPSETPADTRVSPIREASNPSSNSSPEPPPTASTESNKTVREGMTPGLVARTPSYPFPRMQTPGYRPSQFSLQTGYPNPTGSPVSTRVHDQITSDPSTPASAMTFLPPGDLAFPDDPMYPTPNLYELSLMLSAEPGLDDWWSMVVHIMTKYYMAERISLSIPADATDIDNVPWGQKATYNVQLEDELSIGYLARGSSQTAKSADGRQELPVLGNLPTSESLRRPHMQSRHSFTTYEEKREDSRRVQSQEQSSTMRRPGLTLRSKSHYPGTERGDSSTPHPPLKQEALEKHDAATGQIPVPSWEATIDSGTDVKGQVLPVLQALDLEADPLIDHNGITRVIERGKVIALTRTYPYLAPENEEPPSKRKSSRPTSLELNSKHQSKQGKAESSTNLSSLLANASAPLVKGRNKAQVFDGSKIPNLFSVIDDAPPRPPTPRYEEFEQAPPSPWSQSPAPSPAVRPDPSENPFFTDAMVDEESFNPGPSPHDYSSMRIPETIGVDNSWTVLHIPLNHILLSRSPQRFKLDPTVLQEKTNSRPRTVAGMSPRPLPTDLSKGDRSQPIAILSILSPIIPYPTNLRHSLEHLAAHLATSFSLCRQYSNLETEVIGLSRKRPLNAGFGGIGLDGRPIINPNALIHLAPDEAGQQSIGGSITSPSDYSTQSRSITASPAGTPLWEPGSFGLVVDRRPPGTSPGSTGGDSYFNQRSKGTTHIEPSSATSQRMPRSAKDASSYKQHRRSVSLLQKAQGSPRESEPSDAFITSTTYSEDEASPYSGRQRQVSRDSVDQINRKEDAASPQDSHTPTERMPKTGGVASSKHTKLHSYGADFSATFQSLPPSTPLLTRPTTQQSSHSRSGSVTNAQVSMSPPTDRLKGLMLDLLPVQVFVAWPITGEIVWVNSRYLTYRGQLLADLVADPWASFHDEDREDYIRSWTHSLRTGEQFVHTVRLRRFDGAYRWHQARAVASRDKRGIIVQFIGSYMDIHDQKIAELNALRQAEIEASEAKHRLLANLIPQILFTATESEGITFANEQWLSYTGQTEEGPLGLGFMDFVHPEDLARCRVPREGITRSSTEKGTTTFATGLSSIMAEQKPGSGHNRLNVNGLIFDLPNAELSELARNGIIKVTTDSNGRLSYTTEVRLRSKSGEYRWHLIRCVEIDDVGFGGGASSYFGSATDINDHKLLEAKLKEAMESKGRFLSNMSHEIRTPLIGISGMVSFLQDTTLTEEQRDFTNTIQTSANSLLMIINDILDLSKVDAGMMKLKFEWFHTRSLIEDVNELVSTMAIAKRLELNYVVEENVPSWVKGDKVRIRQVLLNVIGNAIKFTSEGEVFSRCRVYSEHSGDVKQNQMILEYSVIDTGRGFTEKEAELIFKPFSQIDGSSTRQHGGSGLGLVISRQLVELHGGHMEGTAVPGKGSMFTFTARFGLPSTTDHPDVMHTPPMAATIRTDGEDKTVQSMRPLLLHRMLDQPLTASPGSDVEVVSPALASSGSSDPSIRTQNTTRSSVSSINVGLAHFSEAAKASGQDLSQMKLEMPYGKNAFTPLPEGPGFQVDQAHFRPPMYSILIICPPKYSREAISKHIETTLPKDVPHQITSLASVSDAAHLIGGHESVTFTHVVLNLQSAEEIISVTDQIAASSGGKSTALIMSDSVHRQAVLKLASDAAHRQLLAEKRIIFVHKPVKPSRFAVIFDPAKERDLSTDLNRSSAAQMVDIQKQNYLNVEKLVGNKGFRVLLVEDNIVNQKVLARYLKKVGIESDLAADGVEATEKVFAQPVKYYSLILCDLHMPRKDGYQTCREIREWERRNHYKAIPIIALSANVMSDVQEKCTTAGFNDYVTKPVDFVDLSTAMSKYF
ncbi:hypothetical protein F5Y16DRAFT_368873 [Xylariaceae sp. FL0255]|nr:hypothetical protein F5Y16DRAFT_368873 [Xylariaceae sp. FL0255]